MLITNIFMQEPKSVASKIETLNILKAEIYVETCRIQKRQIAFKFEKNQKNKNKKERRTQTCSVDKQVLQKLVPPL